MCSGCWNVKTFEAKLKNNEDCSGQFASLTLSELKNNLIQEWIETSVTHFNVFRKAISDAINQDELEFEISCMKNDSVQTALLHVHLV